ncbi:Peptidyl-prolyl cis-trans isomerase [Amphibalanus amphitrite]|uniref:Peptidyl-prolyl cis-trans isomerase n=1 Tax=Amphibalanus amphitrite TaxID=1232801 RepID=A0A6A4VRJ2_AMPAM|nr:Peptidyl-prolyl cis-trans isomerase [Amphibalanus amphitrite]
MKALEEESEEDAIRQVIDWVEVELSAPMREERREEIGQILADVEEQCEHCCENLARAVVFACTRLRRSGSLPARLPKTAISAPLPAPVRPRFLLRFSTDGGTVGGAVVVETRPEVAPRLAALFAAGCAGPYRGARVLRCVPGWWLQAGPVDSAAAGQASAVCARLAESHETRLETRPGAVELLSARLGASEDDEDATDSGGDGGAARRPPRGGGWLVGPQFFIHLRSYSFTHVLGYVVEGLEHVARLASSGDPRAAYTPRRSIWVAECGPLGATWSRDTLQRR